MNYKLTIAIPTYNRGEILADNLSNIFLLIDERIQVLVSDNCSNDNTAIFCRKYRDRSNFTYTKNITNIGYDLNIINCIHHSLGEYIWFLADDDKFSESVLEQVMAGITQENMAGLLLDAQVVDPKNNEIIHKSLSNSIGDTNAFVDEVVFIDNFKWSTLISSQVIRKQNINIKKLDKAIGTVFVQLPLFWNSCFGKKIRMISSEKLIKYDKVTNNFGESTAGIWLWNLADATEVIIKNGISRASTKEALKAIYSKGLMSKGGVLAHYFLSRAAGEGMAGLDGYRKVARYIPLSKAEHFIILCLSLIPSSLFAVIVRVYRGLK